MLQEQEHHSQQSPSASNSDLNSIVSEDEDEIEGNNNQIHALPAKEKMLKKRDFIDDHRHKQIHRMRIAPPAPPLRKPSQVLQSVSQQITWSLFDI